MVAHRREISTVASAVVATVTVIVGNIRKERYKLLIKEAVTDRHITMTIRHIEKRQPA